MKSSIDHLIQSLEKITQQLKNLEAAFGATSWKPRINGSQPFHDRPLRSEPDSGKD
jgi:hypothetical protein